MKRVIGAMLGALFGLAFSTSGLIDLSDGFTITRLGGNEATSMVTAVGTAIGALLGATVLWRFPLAIIGAILGLAAGMWLRDNQISGSQAPRVFLLIFGLPAIAAAGGYLLHLPRTTWARHATTAGVLAGLGTAVVSYAAALSFWTTAIRDTSCDARDLGTGKVLIPLCSAPTAPFWVILVPALFGVAIGVFIRAKLNSADALGPDASPQTS